MWIVRIQAWQALKSFEWSENGGRIYRFLDCCQLEIWKNSKINVQKIPPIPNRSRDEILLINTLIKYWMASQRLYVVWGSESLHFAWLGWQNSISYCYMLPAWIWILFTIWLCVLNVAMISGRLELQLLEVHFTPALNIGSVCESSASLNHLTASPPNRCDAFHTPNTMTVIHVVRSHLKL